MPTLSQKQVNNRAAELLENIAVAFMIPRAWARGAMARDAAGNEAEYYEDKACSFCSLGALHAARRDLNLPAQVQYTAQNALQRVIDQNPRLLHNDIAGFNDASRDKYRVIEAFQTAAASLR